MTIKKIRTGNQCVYKYYTQTYGYRYMVEVMINRRHFSKYRIKTIEEAISWRDDMRSNSQWLKNLAPLSYSDIELYTLKDIHKYINDCLGIEIKDLTRKRNVADGRFLFFALARKCTKLSLEKIGAYLEKDHTTCLHGINVFDSVLINETKYKKIYFTYIDGRWIDPNKDVEERNKFLEERNNFLETSTNKLKIEFTQNELDYRKLSEANKKIHDERVSAMLRMMNIKKVKETDKYEQIKCSA